MLGTLLASVVVTVTTPAVESVARDQEPSLEAGEEGSGEALTEVLASCRTALGQEACQEESSSGASWKAHVVFSSDGARVTLTGPNRVVVRRLEFLPGDSPKQRHVAAGLLVAAMTAAARLSEPAPSPETPRDPPEPPQNAARAPEDEFVPPVGSTKEQPRESPGSLSIEAAAAVGPTLDVSHLGWGGRVGLGLRLGVRWWFGTTFEGRAASTEQWRSLDLQLAAGPSFALTAPATFASFRVAAEGVIDRMEVAHRPLGEPAQNAVRGGGRVRAFLVFGRGRFTPLFGGGLTALGPRLQVALGGEPAIEVPAFLGMGYLGISYNTLK